MERKNYVYYVPELDILAIITPSVNQWGYSYNEIVSQPRSYEHYGKDLTDKHPLYIDLKDYEAIRICEL